MADRETHHTDDRGVVEVLERQEYERRNPGADVAECGACGRMWDDAVVTGLTPTPAARCPFEAEHELELTPDELLREHGHPGYVDPRHPSQQPVDMTEAELARAWKPQR